MSKYQALDPNVEVIGAAILSVTTSLGDEATQVLKDHNLYPVIEDKWYPQQNWLDSFEDLSSNFMNLVAIGMKIPDNAVWPPDVQNVHDALASINVAYEMNHRGGEVGGYHYEKIGETSGRMVCDNPYPSDFDYGIIYRTVQKFREAGTNMLVKLDDSQPTRKQGGKSCTYLIDW